MNIKEELNYESKESEDELGDPTTAPDKELRLTGEPPVTIKSHFVWIPPFLAVESKKFWNMTESDELPLTDKGTIAGVTPTGDSPDNPV